MAAKRIYDIVCLVEVCMRKPSTKGYCRSHHRQIERAGRITNPNLAQLKTCAVRNCDTYASAKDLCRSHWLRLNKYSLTTEELVVILDRNGGMCPVCNLEPATHIDHDHSCCPGEGSCGKCVRGAICNRCNRGLGLFKDDMDSLVRAVAYLMVAQGSVQ